MYFKQILDERCGCASYLIASRQSHEAAIVDPAIDPEQYEALLAERGFPLRYVIDTHVHADHVSGARGGWPPRHGAELCLHESARRRLSLPAAARRRGAAAGAAAPARPAHARPPAGADLDPGRQPAAQPGAVDGADRRLAAGRRRRPARLRRRRRARRSTRAWPGCCACRTGWRSSPATSRGRAARACAAGRARRSASSASSTRWRASSATPSSPSCSDGVPARPLNMTAIEATNRGLADWSGRC